MTRRLTALDKKIETQDGIRSVYASQLLDYVDKSLGPVIGELPTKELKRLIGDAMRQEYNAGYLQGSSDSRYN
jgi:hypothetical protein